MEYQQAYKVAEEINTFFGLGFDGRKLAQLSQILINNAAQHRVQADGAKRSPCCGAGVTSHCVKYGRSVTPRR